MPYLLATIYIRQPSSYRAVNCCRSLLGIFHKFGNTREAQEKGAGVEILRYTQKRSTLANAILAFAVATQRIQPLRSIISPPWAYWPRRRTPSCIS